MNFLKYTKLYFALAIIAISLSIYSIFAYGLEMGIDFEGGSSINATYKSETIDLEKVKEALSGIPEMEGVQIQPLNNNEIALKVNKKDISADVYQKVLTQLKTVGEIEENSVSIETISPLIGKELKDKTVGVVIVALLAMLIYIALAFRNVGKPISSFQYGFSSTLMLFHDIIIPLGVLAFMGAQLSIPIITALLTVVGYCINNTVVVFDRIRENLQRDRKSSYAEIVNKSLNETIARCINTSLAVIIALVPLYYFFSNEESLKYFTLTMGIGVIVGIFSSVFLASPLLVAWNNYRQNKGKR
jgi:preprotein translocase subunit SecF